MSIYTSDVTVDKIEEYVICHVWRHRFRDKYGVRGWSPLQGVAVIISPNPIMVSHYKSGVPRPLRSTTIELLTITDSLV